jgi:predicted dehydrogenase
MPEHRAAAIADSTLERAYGHAIHKAFYGLPNVDVVALADPLAEPRAERAAEIGNPKEYDDYRDMLAAEQPDLVAICPHHFEHHGRWLLEVIASGVKGIYIEKPITASLDEADAVVAAADAAGTKIAVAHQNRYRPGMRHIQDLVRNGDLGTLKYMNAMGKCDKRGGTHDLRVLGTHLLDALRFIAGDVAWATGHMQKNGRDVVVGDVFEGPEGLGEMAGDALAGYFAFESGAIARFDSYARESGGGTGWFGFELWGTEAGISVRDGGRSVYRYPSGAFAPGDTSLRWERLDAPEILNPDGTVAEDPQLLDALNHYATADVVDCVENGGEPVSSAREATAALEMIMAILEGQRTGARVNFPMETRQNPLGLWVKESQ